MDLRDLKNGILINCVCLFFRYLFGIMDVNIFLGFNNIGNVCK